MEVAYATTFVENNGLTYIQVGLESFFLPHLMNLKQTVEKKQKQNEAFL